ncbi:CopG family transcriptional regulator [Tunicatimonas pelagia]|uniref:ribbon-helix-helix domain-containing protein n=1 Tax=Tunicatimonas pelagia TaxID=931531 RepID=UPI0026661544|nr:CopG family transcriptional regulator [Tunicatimonas pelagia]WKN40738.1 ribbon-helix-helix domain-containing protein [Tunicatimonas pelagia]
MNISIYLPEALKIQIDSYAKNKGISKNAAIRRAIEQLLQREQKSSWGTWIDKLVDEPTLDRFESYRSELKSPRDDIF